MVDVFTFKNGKIQVKNAYKQRPALPREAAPRPEGAWTLAWMRG